MNEIILTDIDEALLGEVYRDAELMSSKCEYSSLDGASSHSEDMGLHILIYQTPLIIVPARPPTFEQMLRVEASMVVKRALIG